jgi:hypothetical protein
VFSASAKDPNQGCVVKIEQLNNPGAALAAGYFAPKWDDSMWRRGILEL